LGTTVTIRLTSGTARPEIQVPIGALFDDGRRTGVWLLDRSHSTVHFRSVKLLRLTSETALVSGLAAGDPVIALGADLLREGARVRTVSESGNG
jgi:hypothetical protein